MRLIDADKFIERSKEIIAEESKYEAGPASWARAVDYEEVIDEINEQPTIDAVPVVRCKDCTYCSHFTDGHLECRLLYNLKPVATTYCQMEENDFCSYGKEKEIIK